MSNFVKQSTPGTTEIAVTGTTDEYLIAEKTGRIVEAVFSSLASLDAHDDNNVTFSITNLGQNGSGDAEILAAVDANTTKETGGSAIVANARRTLVLSETPADLNVTEGDRLLIRATAAGELDGAVTRPVYQITIKTTQR